MTTTAEPEIEETSVVRSPLSMADRHRTLLATNNAIVTSLRKEELLQASWKALKEVLSFDAAGIALEEPETDALRFYALEGELTPGKFAVGDLVGRSECCFGAAMNTQRPIVRQDVEVERVFASDDRLKSEGMRSYCTVPMILRGKSIGAVSVVSRTPGRYRREDAELLQEVANQLALAISNMRAYEQIDALKRRLQVENVKLRRDVRDAEAQVLLAENAAHIGRLAAALSHELNSPIGVLQSALESSFRLAERERSLTPPREASVLEGELRRTMVEASTRLREVASRIKRLTNLDRSDIVSVDLNALITDVVGLLKSQIPEGVDVTLDLQPIPSLQLRPQQMSAVFMSLLQNALESDNGAERVTVSTRTTETEVQVRVEDDGRGLDPDRLEAVFEPSFVVSGARVHSGNWSLFAAQQMVRAHGGRIEIEAAPTRGALVCVRLPASLQFGFLPSHMPVGFEDRSNLRAQRASETPS